VCVSRRSSPLKAVAIPDEIAEKLS
jgi:hypothetical protein